MTRPPKAALREFERFEATRIRIVEGCGRDGHGTVREVEYVFDERGDLIRRHDPIELDCGELLQAAYSLVIDHHAAHVMEAGVMCPICVKNGVEDERLGQLAKASAEAATA